MDNEPFFTRDGAAFIPTLSSRGPWDPKSLHGRVVIGLLGARIEALHGGPEFTPARLTVDMYRLPGLDPITVTTRLARDGYRIKVVEAELFGAGVWAACGRSARSMETWEAWAAGACGWPRCAPWSRASP